MKKSIVSLLLLLFCVQFSYSQAKFTYGLFTAIDFNIYKNFNENSSDASGSSKLAIGLSVGGSFDYKLNDFLYLNSNPTFAQKKYIPNRAFNFGILRTVKQNNIAVPLNLKVDLTTYFYVFGGVTVQHVAQVSTDYDFNPGFDLSSDYLEPSTHAFPNMGAGIKFKADGAMVKLQLNYRFLRSSQEFLNPGIDKIALGLIISK